MEKKQMNRTPRWLLTGLAAAALAGCTIGGVPGSGKSKSEKRSVGTFTSVSVGGAFALDLRQGSPASVELTGDDNLLPLITTRIDGKRLVVGTKRSIAPRSELSLRVSAPRLEGLRVSGAVKGTVADVDADRFTLEVSGAASLELSGNVESAELTLSGAGKVRAESLRAGAVRARLSGASTISVHASRSLDVDISGAGKVSYSGDPKDVKQKISGVGKLVKR